MISIRFGGRSNQGEAYIGSYMENGQNGFYQVETLVDAPCLMSFAASTSALDVNISHTSRR